MSDDSTAVLQGLLERAATGDAAVRRRLLELTRDRLSGHARRFLHGRYARLEPFAQTDDVVQQLYLDPAALANLPEAERQAWLAFWQDVEGLLGGPVPAR